MLVVVADSADEGSYVPPLQAAGYPLRIREPGWHQHRLFTGPTARSTCTSSPSVPPKSTGSSSSATSCGAARPTVTCTPPPNGGSPARNGKTCKATPPPSPTSSRRSSPAPIQCLINERLRDN